MNTYTVLDQGKPIATGLISKKVAELIGTDRETVTYHARTKQPCLGRYTLVIDGQVDDNDVHRLTPSLEKAWNNMREAADLLKSGKGEIVTKNGKKYVEVI